MVLTCLDLGLELLKEVVLDKQVHAVRPAVVIMAEGDDEVDESQLPPEQGLDLDVAVTVLAGRCLELEGGHK
jgi:hypothetical protein